MSVIKTVKISVPDVEGGYVVINEADLQPEHVLFEDAADSSKKETDSTESSTEKEPVEKKPASKKKVQTTLD